MSKIIISTKTQEVIKPIVIEMIETIKRTNDVFTSEIIEGMTLCLESIVVDSKKENSKKNSYKEFANSLGNILYHSIAMKQDRKKYKKVKVENVCRFFELTFGTLGQLINKLEADYYPFIKNTDTLETGVKFYSENAKKYISDTKKILDETERNIKL